MSNDIYSQLLITYCYHMYYPAEECFMINISYKYVLAVANYRNMRKAAASLCITQPALTKYINRLEEDLGVRLFNRSTTPITLTESGRRFIEAASTISNLEDAL